MPALLGEFDGALSHLAITRRNLGDSADLSALVAQWTQAGVTARKNAALAASNTPVVESTAPPVPALRHRKRDAKLSADARHELDRHFQDGMAAFRRNRGIGNRFARR